MGVCPGEEREGWGRQCEERTVEVKVETKGDSKEVKATREGRQPESRIPEVPDTSNSSSTPLSMPPPASSCYNIEDILSEIVLPPPLSPQLEDLTNFREEERRSHLACRERLAPSSSCQQSLAGTESSCPNVDEQRDTVPAFQPASPPFKLGPAKLLRRSCPIQHPLLPLLLPPLRRPW